jgi:hypothetical protein
MWYQCHPMDAFEAYLRDWQVFYATLAAACATLVGLLFLAFTLRAESLNRRENAWQLRIARKSFGDFLLVLMTALIFLVPRMPPVGLAVGLSVLGAVWSGNVCRLLVVMLRARERRLAPRYLLRVFGPSLSGGLGLIAVAAAVLLGYLGALYWLMAVLAALLASASSTAWTIMAGTGSRARPGKAADRQPR